MCTRDAVFYFAYVFTGDLSKWDVSSVRNMQQSASLPILSIPCPCVSEQHTSVGKG
eukprot:COSAG01_NODE_11257_length_1971_cov_2.328526_1_plen_55_part_10